MEPIPGEVAARLAEYFNVTTDYLLGLTDNPAVPFRLSPKERTVISDFRTLSAEQRELVVQSIALMKEQNERS